MNRRRLLLSSVVTLALTVSASTDAAVTIQHNCRVGNAANDLIDDIPHLGCLRGGGGIDRLRGFGGNDKLDGQTGNRLGESDDLYGGLGVDIFYVGPGAFLTTPNLRNVVARIHDYENNEVICSAHPFGSTSWYIKVINGEHFVVARTIGAHTVLARIVNWGTGKRVAVRPVCNMGLP